MPAGHDITDPSATISPEAHAQPTPVGGHGYAGVAPYNLSTDPNPATTGIRLDKAFGVLRDFETASYFSEHQQSNLFGVTILPFQTPCTIVGVRVMGGYADNLSMTDDSGIYSIDGFFGTRYKRLYAKVGGFIDDYDRFTKAGITYGAMTELPIFGLITLDTAFGLRGKEDEFRRDVPGTENFRARRIEQSNEDIQIRVGRFWNECVQTGFTYNYYSFDFVEDEWGAGCFANLFLGRYRLGLDLTGGEEGLRGYLKFAVNWGAHPQQRPRDCRVMGGDTVGWVTRVVDRDQSIRMRESLTGPAPFALSDQ
jgi:hypothetical protein